MIPSRAQSLAESRRRTAATAAPTLFPSPKPPALSRAAVPANARAEGGGSAPQHTPSRLSPPQIRLIAIARNAARVDGQPLNDGQYRTLLRTVAGVSSSKELDNRGLEAVMAVFEELGFVDRVHGVGYWGRASGRRLIHYVKRLAGDSRYNLAALVLKFSGGRTDNPDKLLPREAWKLVEMLKASNARESHHVQTETIAERAAADPSAILHGLPRSDYPRQPAHPTCPAPAGGRSGDVPGLRPPDGHRPRQDPPQPHQGGGGVGAGASSLAAAQSPARGLVSPERVVGLTRPRPVPHHHGEQYEPLTDEEIPF